MKKYLFAVVASVLIVGMGIVIAIQAVNHKKMVDEKYRWVRSECESAGRFISEYIETKDEEKYHHAVSRVYGAMIMALQIDNDEQIVDLSLELISAYGNLVRNPEESKAVLEQLGGALFDFGTEGSAEEAEQEIRAFNHAVTSMMEQ